jgi:hypothetical protein
MERGAASYPDFFIRFPGFSSPVVGVRVPGYPETVPGYPKYRKQEFPDFAGNNVAFVMR